MKSTLAGLLMACFYACCASAGTFYEYGPIACSSELPVVQEYAQDKLTIAVTLDDGTTRRFRAIGTSREIGKRQLPAKASFRFGPRKIVDCTVDTTKVVGAICTDYPTRRGWGGQCDYCALEKDGTERCRHIQGQLIEIPKERRARTEATSVRE